MSEIAIYEKEPHPFDFTLVYGQEGDAGIVWIMDYEPGVDTVLLNLWDTVESIATQVGEHLRLDWQGRTVWLANTELEDLSAWDIL